MLSNSLLFSRIRHLPVSMIISIMCISFFGIAMLYSAAGGSFFPWAMKQIIYLILAIICMCVVSAVDIRVIYSCSYLFYIASIILLVLVEIKGHKAMGASRWIDLFFFKLQPSDIVKLSLILALSRYYHDLKYKQIGKIRSIIIPVILIAIPILLVLKQPDLGTSIILLLLSISILFVSGIKTWKFVLVFVVTMSSIPFLWTKLHTYQKSRITIFLNPESDPLGSGYNIMQSKIAIGSGGITGKGFIDGSQSQLNFLPERHTDFIFTMFAEEFGFIGCTILLILYTYITSWGIKIAFNCKHHFGRILSSGVSSLFFIHVIINIGMVMGLLPVVGAPLPLMSYGGTIVVTIFCGFGLLINAHTYRKTHMNKAIKTIF